VLEFLATIVNAYIDRFEPQAVKLTTAYFCLDFVPEERNRQEGELP
jgi:hypothetical protein